MIATRRSARDRLRFDVVVTSGAGLGVYALALITGPLLARTLSPAGRGDLAAVIVPTQVLGFVLLFGLPHASAYYATRRETGDLMSNAWLVAAVVSTPIVVALSPFVPRYLADHDDLTVPWFYAFLGLSVVFLPVSTSLDIVRARGLAVRYNVLRSLPIVLNFLGIVALAVLDRLTLRSALTSAFVATMLAGAITLGAAGGLRVRRPDLSLMRLEAAYAWRAAGGTLSQMLLARFDQLVMVAMVDNTQLGLYVVAATGASVSSPIGQGVALALFSHVRSTSGAEADAQTRRALVWSFASSVGVALVVAAVAPFLVPFFFGEDFRGSVAPLLLMLPGQVALDVANVHASRLEASGRPGAASIGLFSGAILTVVGIVAVVPSFGINGAAVVTSLSYLLYLSVVWYLRRRPPPTADTP